MTRGQMAAFMVRAFGYIDRGTTDFVDDDGSIFEADIERLAAAGVDQRLQPARQRHVLPQQPGHPRADGRVPHRASGSPAPWSRTVLWSMAGPSTGVTDDGVVLVTSSPEGEAVLWDPLADTLTFIESPTGGGVRGDVVSGTGMVAGIYETTGPDWAGFMWNPSTEVLSTITAPDGGDTYPRAISDLGSVVGDYDGNGCFFWSPGGTRSPELWTRHRRNAARFGM